MTQNSESTDVPNCDHNLTPEAPVEIGNTDRESTSTYAAKHWFATIPEIDSSKNSRDSSFFIKKFRNLKIDYIFQLEAGEQTGYRHYQAYLCLPKKQRCRWLERNICSRGRFRVCDNINRSKVYCSKADTRIEGPWQNVSVPRDNYALLEAELNHPLRPWQDDLKQYILGPVDPRKVRIYVDETGNQGKTWFVKHMAFYFPHLCTYITTTRNADILTAVGEDTQCVLIDIPRCVSSNDIFPANAIEQIKNGVITQGKLLKELQFILIPACHVVVFTNTDPDRSKLSADRWDVVYLRSV